MCSRTTNLVSGGVPGGDNRGFASEELMNLEMTSRQRPDRRAFNGCSGGPLIVSADQTGLIRLWKGEHREVESKSHRARSRVRIAAARRKSATPRLHPVSSVVRWLFKLFVFFLNPASCSRTPSLRPVSGIKTKPAASITDPNISTVLSREAQCLKSIDGAFTLPAAARPGDAPVKTGTCHAALNRVTW
jgi:hypothetical protein